MKNMNDAFGPVRGKKLNEWLTRILSLNLKRKMFLLAQCHKHDNFCSINQETGNINKFTN